MKYSVLIILSLISIIAVVFGIQRLTITPSTITVIGTGRLTVPAGKLSMIVTKDNIGSSADSTIEMGEIALSSLIETAKNIAGKDIEITKSFYSIQSAALSATDPTSRLYQVQNAFLIRTDQVAKASELVRQLYTKGATSVTGINFEAADKTQREQEAREKAVADAKDQGVKISSTIGRKLGRVISITDDQSGASSSVSSVKEGSTDTIEIVKNVSITYELK